MRIIHPVIHPLEPRGLAVDCGFHDFTRLALTVDTGVRTIEDWAGSGHSLQVRSDRIKLPKRTFGVFERLDIAKWKCAPAVSTA